MHQARIRDRQEASEGQEGTVELHDCSLAWAICTPESIGLAPFRPAAFCTDGRSSPLSTVE